MARSKEVMVRQMFADIAPTYDRLNTILSLNIHHVWRRAALDAAHLQPGHRVLDLATGTADLALGVAARVGPAGRVVGADNCEPILRLGQAKVRTRGTTGVAFAVGAATALPFQDGCFDAVLMAFALRNVPDVGATLAEMARVTRAGGWVVNLELTRPIRPWLRPFYRLYQDVLMPAVGGLFSGKRDAYLYLPRSIQGFPPPEAIAAQFSAAGLRQVGWRPLSGGLATIHWGQRA